MQFFSWHSQNSEMGSPTYHYHYYCWCYLTMFSISNVIKASITNALIPRQFQRLCNSNNDKKINYFGISSEKIHLHIRTSLVPTEACPFTKRKYWCKYTTRNEKKETKFALRPAMPSNGMVGHFHGFEWQQQFSIVLLTLLDSSVGSNTGS